MKIVLRILGAAALLITLGVIIFFAYTLILRNDYRAAALNINEAVLAGGDRITVSRGDTTLPADQRIVDYYNRFLLDGNTAVYSRIGAPLTDQSIRLSFPDGSALTFTGLEDGSAIALCWATSQGQKQYRVRSSTTFMQLHAFFSNYQRSIDQP